MKRCMINEFLNNQDEGFKKYSFPFDERNFEIKSRSQEVYENCIHHV